MVLAAGLGKRMLPLTATLPKPLVEVAGRTLLDRCLDTLQAAGIERAVVNVHHFPDRMIDHLRPRASPSIFVSDERDQLLDSAGGIVKALSVLGHRPFLVLNADTFWIDRGDGSNLERLALAWDDARMDILLMLADSRHATGHSGATDFLLDGNGRLARARGAVDGWIYAGAAIVHPRVFDGVRTHPHSLNQYFDRAIEAGRLHGMPMDGHWITVGTPDAIPAAEEAVARLRER
jgi:MurNAc alpha-1-phosphate uridylyltransferase